MAGVLFNDSPLFNRCGLTPRSVLGCVGARLSAVFRKNWIVWNLDAQRIGTVGFLN